MFFSKLQYQYWRSFPIPPRTLPKEEDRPLVDEEGFAVLDTIPKTEETPSFPMLLSSTLPNDSQEVGARLPLTFSFDRVMNTKSVEDAFSLSPNIPGTFYGMMTISPLRLHQQKITPQEKRMKHSLLPMHLMRRGTIFPKLFKRHLREMMRSKFLRFFPPMDKSFH